MVSTLEPICAEISGGSPDIASTANISTGRDQGPFLSTSNQSYFFNQQMNILRSNFASIPKQWGKYISLQCQP